MDINEENNEIDSLYMQTNSYQVKSTNATHMIAAENTSINKLIKNIGHNNINLNKFEYNMVIG